MELVKVALFLDTETMDFYGRTATEVGVFFEEFVSDMLIGHFEICSFGDNVCPAIDPSLN